MPLYQTLFAPAPLRISKCRLAFISAGDRWALLTKSAYEYVYLTGDTGLVPGPTHRTRPWKPQVLRVSLACLFATLSNQTVFLASISSQWAPP